MQFASNDTASHHAVIKGLRALAQESQHQIKALQLELGEIKVLIKQTSSEIERLGARNADTARRVRELDANMDHFSRQEIRDTLTSAQDAEMRLFMMKGQMEMLEHKQRTLERLRSQMQAILDLRVSVPDDGRGLAENDGALDDKVVEGIVTTHGPIVAQIIHAQENERQRLARQLHDGPAQALTNLILRAEICQRMLDLSPGEAHSELASLKGMIVNTLQDTRGFIFDLRPMILDDLGLVPTLRRQAEIFSARSHVPVLLNVSGVERRLPPEAEVVIFRVVQEALDNAARHGKASEIQVSADINNDDIKVTVEDNGQGFDVSKVMASSRQRKALGFRGVQEQVSAVGGHLSFESSPGQGSKVTVRIPF